MANTKTKKSKTETSKERLIYVYLPSHEMTEKWKKLANKSDTSISKFVIEHVENSIQQEDGKESYITRIELLKEVQQLKEENQQLRKQNKMMDTVVDRLDSELRGYRVQPFVEEDFTGIRKYETEIIALFKQKKEIRKEDLLDFLHINATDSKTVKGIQKQIENLEQYGLIKDRGVKWTWAP